MLLLYPKMRITNIIDYYNHISKFTCYSGIVEIYENMTSRSINNTERKH